MSDNGKKKKILVVDDEVALFQALMDELDHSGFEAIGAKDGEEGLKLALEQHPDLILLDIVMPKMDGMTMMKKLRQNDWGKSVPIILLTHLEADDQIMKGISRDEPAFYLLKSHWELQDVIDKIREVLRIAA
jgi:DNA-binding response OmpR family regulator